MWAALGHILPIAVAVALSSIPIMAAILILLSPNKRRSSLMFLIGFVLGLAVTVVAFTLLAQLATPPRRSQADHRHFSDHHWLRISRLRDCRLATRGRQAVKRDPEVAFRGRVNGAMVGVRARFHPELAAQGHSVERGHWPIDQGGRLVGDRIGDCYRGLHDRVGVDGRLSDRREPRQAREEQRPSWSGCGHGSLRTIAS